jgi:hypothetical protein
MFSSSTGGAVPQTLDPSIFVTAATNKTWIYRKNLIILENVGGSASATGDYTIIAADLKLAICEQINSTLYGSTTVPVLAAAPLASFIGSVGGTAPYFVTATGALSLTATTIDGKMNGCFATSDVATAYVYIHTLLAQ